jgi:hypothetical protein
LNKRLLIAPLFALLIGCNHNKELMPFLGKWSGSFEVAEITGGGTAKDLKRESLKGYVQVYATERSYKMEMEGEQETVNISGFWTISGNRITLKPERIGIDDRGGEDKRDPNKKFIPSEDVQAAYGRPLVLSEAADKKSLTGLKITIGKLVGTHRFVKDSF